MTDTFRALCAELLAAIQLYTKLNPAASDMSPFELTEKLMDAMAATDAALAQPVAEGPTDEELLRIAAIAIEPYESSGIASGEYEPETECAVEAYGSELIAYARAALARFGHPTPQPVAVSERLPGPEDCDEQGRCWLGGHQMGNGTPTWLLGYPAWAKRFPDVHRFWLPAHALPTPEAL
jgi:hypothetical protein